MNTSRKPTALGCPPRIVAKCDIQAEVIEGPCDERGSAGYNLGLATGARSAVKELLCQLGVSTDRLIQVNYGKERPQCTESNETCWQKNRRFHLVPGGELKTSIVCVSDDSSEDSLRRR